MGHVSAGRFMLTGYVWCWECSSLACTMELFDKPGKLYSICSVVFFLKPCARLNIFSGSGKKFQATRLKMHLLESWESKGNPKPPRPRNKALISLQRGWAQIGKRESHRPSAENTRNRAFIKELLASMALFGKKRFDYFGGGVSVWCVGHLGINIVDLGCSNILNLNVSQLGPPATEMWISFFFVEKRPPEKTPKTTKGECSYPSFIISWLWKKNGPPGTFSPTCRVSKGRGVFLGSEMWGVRGGEDWGTLQGRLGESSPLRILLLMAEFRLTSWYVIYPIIDRVSYIPGFSHQQC